ncbi:MAG: MFS transporter [Gordonia sp. (in: high G+C Gram-positive bacteria)]|uniref:MFS transporter n=1 Tax=Gordonia sp. (in: high G+C Gram-positive bacteria) TaxID=84139 RepID=UPI0039E4351E
MLIRLLATRLAGQAADGVFQAALFAAIAFNPERQASPLVIAGMLAVLVGPYSLIGPLIGGFLDRWDRRSVLVWANVVRGALMAVAAGLLASGLHDFAALGAALGAMGAARFVAAGLSAALPHVTARDALVRTNALFNALGGFAAMTGVGIAAGGRLLLGAGAGSAAAIMLLGTVGALVAALVARSFPRRSLGPDGEARAVTTSWIRGWRAITSAPTVGVLLGSIAAHRWAFGTNTIVLVLATNNVGETSGLRRFLLMVGSAAVGALLAAISTPILARWAGRTRTLAAALLLGVFGQTLLLTFDLDIAVAAVLLIGWVGQTIKLCGDVAMQTEVPDDSRGEVFAIQDAIFNLVFIAAATTAALIVPTTGRGPIVLIGAGLVYVTALIEVLRRSLAANQDEVQ